MGTKSLKPKNTQRRLILLASFLHRNAILVLLLVSGLTFFFGSLAMRLEQKTTIRDLLPADNPVVHNFEKTVDNFDLIDRVVVVLQFEKDQMEAAQIFADIFVEQIVSNEESQQYLHWMKANIFDQTEQADWHEYLQFLLRLMPAEQIPALTQRLQKEGIFEQVKQNRRELESGINSKILIEKDPLNLVEFATAYSKEITGNYQISFKDGFLTSKDGDMLLILGKPKHSPEDVDFSVALDTFLKQQIEDVKEILREEEDIISDDVLTIGLTGPHPITAHENRIIKSDVIDMFVTSFAMVLFLFILAYGRPLALIYVGVPLLCAEIWTLGFGYLLFGRLNLLTATFSAVIVGLGIDYAIHIFSRYLDERARGYSPEEAMGFALSQTGLGTSVGGITTALAFLAMGISNFSGLREFAAIAAIGIVLCLLMMFTFLPCLLFLRERLRKTPATEQRVQRDFHLAKLLDLCISHKKITLAILGVATLYLGYMAVQLRFTTDIRSVRARSNPSITLQNEVTAKVGGSLRSLTFVLEAETETELYQLHDKLLPVFGELKQEGSLVRYDSLLVVLQSPDNQRLNTKKLVEAGLTSESIKANFTAAMDEHALRITPDSEKYIEHLSKGLDQEPITLEQILESDGNFVRPFLCFDEGRFKSLIHVYPSTGLWEKDATRALTERILAVANEEDSGIFVTGIQTISEELKRLVRRSFKYSTGVAVLLVIGILWVHFRRVSLVFLTLTPLAVAVVWMLGTMKVLGIDITILNFVATPIIIGIGIDDGVHIVEKYLHRKSQPLNKLIASCGKAVTLTSLSTILGFSSLFLAEYSGFRSLGLCAILGVAFCWVGSIILLPLLMDYWSLEYVREDVMVCKTEDDTLS